MSDPDELIKIYRAANVTEAHLVRNMLEDEGVQAIVTEENEPLSGLNLVGCDVMVKRSDETQAEQLIAGYEELQIRLA